MNCRPETKQKKRTAIDIQGHRGCRGLMPENTVAGFLKAIDLGVTTLEMDVVVSKDKIVVVSHEPHFNDEITTDKHNTHLTAQDAAKTNLYHLTFSEIQQYDVGIKPHPRFPQQQKIAATKPSLEEVLQICEQRSRGKIRYNIEIKRTENGDNIVQPPLPEFVNLVLKTIEISGVKDRATIQCFDPEVLNYIHQHKNTIKTILLVENLESPSENLSKLNHTPYGYSPAYKLVNPAMVEEMAKKNIRLVPWTVNDSLAVCTLLDMGVDGIISDYPDMVLKIINNTKNEQIGH